MKTLNPPLLSVIIATKNREFYCIEAIKSILAINSNEIQLTIADNSDTLEVKEFVATISDSRLIYHYNNEPTSSIENFNRCLSLATGEYICLIGDDDSILPSIIETVKWAKSNSIDSFCSKQNLIYYWPNSRNIYPKGFLQLPQVSNNRVAINCNKELIDLLKNGLQHYLLYSLPKTYHGVVSRDLMEKIKQKTGHYYGGLSPDIYSSIAVSIYAENHYEIDFPVSIAGVCATSTTADNFTGKHSGALETMPHLRNRGLYIWSSLIPKYYSVNTVWAESGIKALQEIGREDLISRYFNPYRMMAQAYINNRKFIGDFVIQKSMEFQKEHQISSLIFYPKLFWNSFVIIFKKIKSIMYKNNNIYKEIDGVSDIHQAIILAQEYYKTK